MFGDIARAGGRSCGTLFIALTLLAGALLPSSVHAAALWSVDKLIKENLTAVTGKPVLLPDGTVLPNVRVEYLRTLFEAHKRIGEASKVSSGLALLVETAPNAKAYFAQRVIVVTTGMLEIIGPDPNMVAAVLGHEFAHLALRHAVQRAQNVPALVNGGTAVAPSASTRAQDNAAAMRAGEAAAGLMAASFSRKQEREADRVGVEYMSRAHYNPDGVLKLLQIFVQRQGGKDSGYLDTHPGFQERLTIANATARNQQYDAAAESLAADKRWRDLAALVRQWLAARPDSAGAWYYNGLARRALRQGGVLAAFEQAVAYDPNFMNARLELCVELYRQGRERDSLVCSEYIREGDIHDQYVARTFQHPVIVSGHVRQPAVGAATAQLLQDAAALRSKPPASSVAPVAASDAQRAASERMVKEIVGLPTRIERSAAPPAATQASAAPPALR